MKKIMKKAPAKKRRSPMVLQIDDEILGPALDRIIAFGNNGNPRQHVDKSTMGAIRILMAEAIIAADDLLTSETPSDGYGLERNIVLHGARMDGWSFTRYGLREIYGAKPGQYDQLRKAGPIANAHFFEQAEARMGKTYLSKYQSLSGSQGIGSDDDEAGEEWKKANA